MVNILSKNKGDSVWVVNQQINEMLVPIHVSFDSPETVGSDKLAFVLMNGELVCYPSNLLFETKTEAEIYAAVAFIKMYYSLDPFTLEDDVDDETLSTAHQMMDGFEQSHPDKFLYHWMNDVPNR